MQGTCDHEISQCVEVQTGFSFIGRYRQGLGGQWDRGCSEGHSIRGGAPEAGLFLGHLALSPVVGPRVLEGIKLDQSLSNQYFCSSWLWDVLFSFH